MRILNKQATVWAFAAALGLSIPAAAQTDPMGGQTGGTTAGTGQVGGTTTGGTTTGGTTAGGQMGGQAGVGDDTRIAGSNSRDDVRKFIQKAAISNMAEIQLGQLAQQKAQDPDVKQFAQMMIDQHTKAQSELEQAASSSGATLPTSLDEKHQRIQSKLGKLSGAEFDREYMKVMVDAHQDTQKLLKSRANASASNSYNSGGTAGTSGTGGSTTGTAGTSGTSGSSSTTGTSGSSSSASGAGMSVNGWAATTLPEVQQHLQMAKDLEKRLKNSGKNDKGDKNDKSDK